MNVSWNSGHIPDPDLLLAADGALPPVRAAEIRDHLAECPSCRLRDARLRQTMADVVQAQRHEFDRQLPSMEASTSSLQARLARVPERRRPAIAWSGQPLRSCWLAWAPYYRLDGAPSSCAGGGVRAKHSVDTRLCTSVGPGSGMLGDGRRGAQPHGFRFRRAGGFPALRHTQSAASNLRGGLSDSAGSRRRRRSPQSVAPAVLLESGTLA